MPEKIPPLVLGGRSYELGRRTLIMGIINVTPDSFSDGGNYNSPEHALHQARRLEAQGADILDIGGESTRPFSDPVPEDEELRRVMPALELIRSQCRLPISVDTSKAVVAREAVAAGADMINDVTALRGDRDMSEVVAETGVPVVLMHMKGIPRDMQVEPVYADVVGEIRAFFQERIEAAQKAGIEISRIVLDPGIGFGKTLEHNLEIMRRCGEFRQEGHGVLVGPSRKAFTAALSGIQEPEERDAATVGAIVACVARGCDIVRTHNVAMARDALSVADPLLRDTL